MKMVVIGPGAIGCLFASFLAGAGHTVVLLGRNREHARRISGQGVRVDTANGMRRTAVRATTTPSCASEADWVLLCVKAYDTEAALDKIAPFFDKDRSAAVSFQNGLDGAAALAEMAGAERTVCAATAHGATMQGTGHVRHAGAGPTRLAPYLASCAGPARMFAELLRKAKLSCEYEPDRDRALWTKLALNAGINPVTALENIPNGALLDRPQLFSQAQQAAAEARQVGLAKGVDLRDFEPGAALRRTCLDTAANDSSMLQDLRCGRRTEIDAINGAVVREAGLLGMNAPVNARLAAAIRRRESRA